MNDRGTLSVKKIFFNFAVTEYPAVFIAESW